MTLAQIAIRNCFRHRARSLITLSAIAVGCVTLIFVGAFFEDMFYKMRESYIKGHTGHLQIYRRGFFEHGNARPFDYLIEHAQEITALLAHMDSIHSVTSRLEFAGLLSTGENTVACLAQGVEPQHEPSIRLQQLSEARRDLPSLGGLVVEAGEPLTDAQPYSVILGRGLAAGLGANVGDGLIVVGHTVGGSINALDVNVAGIFFTSAKAFDDRALRLPLPTAQRLLQTDAVQSLVVMLKRTDDTPRIKTALQELFRSRRLDLDVKSWDELSDFYVKTRQLFGRMFFVLKLVIALIVILSIYNTMTMAVLERVTEIGTLRALGTTQRDIRRLFLLEGAVLGCVGGAVGVIAGIVVTLIVRHIGIPMPPPPGATMTWISEPLLAPPMLLLAFVLSLITAIISSVQPAYAASRLEIAQALRHTT